jgi:flavin-dependent dehydrogenase
VRVEAVDVLVLGAGPAGATAALNLAPFRSVLVLERNAQVQPRIGESLPGAAGRLLRDMGLWPGFELDGHLPCHARLSVWGSADPVESDAIRDLDGPGWSLDRARFEARLRVAAMARGARLLAPARTGSLERRDDGWIVEFVHDGDVQHVRSRLLIDARGRSARPMPGASRRAYDRLVCGWISGPIDAAPVLPGTILTEAEADGWWYSIGLPGNRRVVAFHTDADLPAAADASDQFRLLARAGRLSSTMAAVAGAAATGGFCAAHSCRLDPPVGDGWLAAGDACLAFDPLSSQGLLNALFTGLSAAEAVDRIIAGDRRAAGEYAESIEAVWRAYRRHLSLWYGQERRWRHSPFWARRQEG